MRVWTFIMLICALAYTPMAYAAQFPANYVSNHAGAFTQGGLVTLALTHGTTLTLNGKHVPQADGLAVIGFGRDAPLTQYLRFSRDGQSKQVTLMLTKRHYDIQRIDGLPPALVTPPPHMLPRIRHQTAQKNAARQRLTRASWFADGFQWPLTGRVTGVYGSQRFYNGQPRRPHFGIDIAAPSGTPIYAAARGRVTLAEPDMYFEGGLIFIDHGLWLTSAYMHMAQLDVTAGQMVDAGQQIGTVGSSGRSTGPHLDWRLFWGGQRLDPALVAPARD